MTLWACWICSATHHCAHREPELLAWVNALDVQAAERVRDLLALESAKRRQAELFPTPIALVRKAAG